jgi:signal transduction histidine kinase
MYVNLSAAVRSESNDTVHISTARSERAVKQALARELHDTVAQQLTAVLVELRCMQSEQDGRHVAQELDELQTTLAAAVRNLRGALLDLRGQPTEDDSFVPDVKDLLSNFTNHTGIDGRLIQSPSWPGSLSCVASHNLTRVLEEALTNVRAHSGASHVTIELGAHGDELFIEVTDDGRGIVSYSPIKHGLGLTGMFERVAILGGELSISTCGKPGTTVTATFARAAAQ